jgi:hypothetical protein
MAGRTIKGQVAFVSTGLLSVLNLLATIGGIAAIVVICALEHVPSRMGWLFIIVGGFTVVSGLIGLCTSNHQGCFTWQAVLLMFALIGLISTSLLIFFKPTQVLARMNSKYSESTSWKIIKFQAAIFFIVFCIDVSAITHYIFSVRSGCNSPLGSLSPLVLQPNCLCCYERGGYQGADM